MLLPQRIGCDSCEQATLRKTIETAIAECPSIALHQKTALLNAMESNQRFRKKVERKVMRRANRRGFHITRRNRAMGLDLDRLERLLELVIQYLPKLLEIILPLFT